MYIRINKEINKPNFNKDGEILGFGVPFNRALNFGLDEMAYKEVFGNKEHIGFLKLIDEDENVYDFIVDECQKNCLMQFSPKNRAEKKLMCDALDHDYDLLDCYEVIR